jgi:hypothetical protein
MRDMTGFAILVVAMVVILYLLVGVVFPLLVEYCLGIFAFFIVARLLVRRGLAHPDHLDAYLKPGYPMTLALLSVALPVAHSAAYFLFTPDETAFVVLACNGVPTLAWTLHMLWMHSRQKRRYPAEGHDIEDLLEEATSRDMALEVKSDALESLAGEERTPEPWELVVGDCLTSGTERPGVADMLARIEGLRDQYRPLADRLAEALRTIRAGSPPPAGVATEARVALAHLDGPWNALVDASENLLAEALTGRTARWDDDF